MKCHQYVGSVVVVSVCDDFTPTHSEHHHPIVLVGATRGPHTTTIPPLDDYPVTLSGELQRLH